jgi:hypothetical protein
VTYCYSTFLFHYYYVTPNFSRHSGTTVDIPTKFHEVWWKESKFFYILPFLFPWQQLQSLSNWFRFVWRITQWDHSQF